MDFLNFKALFFEFLGTFFIVYTAGWAFEWKTSRMESLLGVALANGALYGVFTFLGKPFSGAHFNPAVTFCLAVTGNIHVLKAILYIFCQLSASIFAGLFLAWLQEDYLEKANRGMLGFPKLGSNITPLAGVFVEMVGSFMLLFMYYCVSVHRTESNIKRLATSAKEASEDNVATLENSSVLIGAIYAFCTMAIGNATGAALNPARVLGPVMIANQARYYGQLWVYFVGPIVGGLLGCFSYILVCMEVTPKEAIKGVDYEEQILDVLQDNERERLVANTTGNIVESEIIRK